MSEIIKLNKKEQAMVGGGDLELECNFNFNCTYSDTYFNNEGPCAMLHEDLCSDLYTCTDKPKESSFLFSLVGYGTLLFIGAFSFVATYMLTRSRMKRTVKNFPIKKND